MMLRRWGIIAIASITMLTSSVSHAASADERQYKIEAAFLYNFFNYITWPGHRSPAELKEVTICLGQNDPMMPYLEYIRVKMAKERTIRIRTMSSGESTTGCQLLFERAGRPALADDLASDILTISDSDEYINQGGMIAIPKQGEHLAMAINNNLLAEHGFQVSSRLLQLAKKIK